MLRIDIDTKEFARVLAPLSSMGQAVNKAVVSAMRRAVPAMQSKIAQGIRRESYLKGEYVREALTPGVIVQTGTSVTGEVRVASRKIGLDRYRLVPAAVTARKRKRPEQWNPAGFRLGPAQRVRFVQAAGGWSKAFVIRGLLNSNGRLRMVQGMGKGRKRKLRLVRGFPVQYFAVFDAVVAPAQTTGRETFEKRLRHEVNRQLEKLK